MHVEKSTLIRVDGSYFALVDSKVLGRGHLMCRATISNEFAGWRQSDCQGLYGYIVR